MLMILGGVGITLVDVSIFGTGSLTSKLVRYLQTQTDENQLPLSDVETETGIKQLSPINEANKEPVTQSLSEETDDNQTRKVEFSRLMGILRDLGYSSARLSFIKANIDMFPDSLSLNELHSVLALFMVDLRISDTFEYYREVWFRGDILGIA